MGHLCLWALQHPAFYRAFAWRAACCLIAPWALAHARCTGAECKVSQSVSLRPPVRAAAAQQAKRHKAGGAVALNPFDPLLSQTDMDADVEHPAVLGRGQRSDTDMPDAA